MVRGRGLLARASRDAARWSRDAARASLIALACSPARRAAACRSAIMALRSSLLIIGPPRCRIGLPDVTRVARAAAPALFSRCVSAVGAGDEGWGSQPGPFGIISCKRFPDVLSE